MRWYLDGVLIGGTADEGFGPGDDSIKIPMMRSSAESTGPSHHATHHAEEHHFPGHRLAADARPSATHGRYPGHRHAVKRFEREAGEPVDTEGLPRASNVKLEGVHPELLARTRRAVADMPPEVRKHFQIISGFRSREQQEAAYRHYLAGGGIAARPGHSQHEVGRALDIQPGPANDWLRAHGHRYGLHFPVPGDRPHMQMTPGPGPQSSLRGMTHEAFLRPDPNVMPGGTMSDAPDPAATSGGSPWADRALNPVTRGYDRAGKVELPHRPEDTMDPRQSLPESTMPDVNRAMRDAEGWVRGEGETRQPPGTGIEPDETYGPPIPDDYRAPDPNIPRPRSRPKP